MKLFERVGISISSVVEVDPTGINLCNMIKFFSAYRTMSESNMLQPWIVSNTCQRTCLGCKRLPYVYRNLSRQRFWWNVVFVEVKKMWTFKHPFSACISSFSLLSAHCDISCINNHITKIVNTTISLWFPGVPVPLRVLYKVCCESI